MKSLPGVQILPWLKLSARTPPSPRWPKPTHIPAGAKLRYLKSSTVSPY
jgi:hypothetical protein